MDDALQALLSAQLQPDEEILWAGRPPLGIRLRPMEALYIPLLALVALTVLRPIVDHWPPPRVDIVWTVAFLLGLLYLAGGRLLISAWQRHFMYYFVTAKQIIIIWRFLRWRVKSVPLALICKVWLRERRNGSGRIDFALESFKSGFGCGQGGRVADVLYLFGIPSSSQIEVTSGARADWW